MDVPGRIRIKAPKANPATKNGNHLFASIPDANPQIKSMVNSMLPGWDIIVPDINGTHGEEHKKTAERRPAQVP
jgi:hypothetical protein